MRRKAAWLLALAISIGACAPDQGATSPTTPAANDPNESTAGGPVGLFASELVQFDSCTAYLDHLKHKALERVGPYGLGGGIAPFALESAALTVVAAAVPEEADAAADFGTVQSYGDGAASEFSTTNVQEAGVDEPDIVKTDGNRILAFAQGVLHYVDMSSGTPKLAASFELSSWKGLDTWSHQMFMTGDTALLMASGYEEERGGITVAVQIDVSDGDDLRVTGSLEVAGWLVSARLVGGRASLVTTSDPAVGFEFVFPSSGSRSAELRAERVNRQVIEDSVLEDWAPWYRLTAGPEPTVTEGLLIDCETAYTPREFPGFQTLSVLTFDASGVIDTGAVATVLSGGDTVYASADHLYVASHRWIDWEGLEEPEIARQAGNVTTDIHRFGIGGADGPIYQASGKVEGFLINQFAMSEHDGYLRVASTNTPDWGWWGTDEASVSRVDVLERDGREMRVVGSVDGLGVGERIFAVRFLGEIGYVVTFRQTDPLYTIDLSDPANPAVLGELKILGYSAYLHPLGEGRLLGVGQDADEEGRLKGTQVSIFDVSDPADPVRTHQFSLPEYSSSDVEFDHRAFLYREPTGTVVLPISWWSYDEATETEDQFSGAMVLAIGPDGIKRRGVIGHSYPEVPPQSGDAADGTAADAPFGYYPEFVPITRSLVIGGTLFTLSDAGLMGSDLASLSETAWIEFPFQGYGHYPFEPIPLVAD